MEKQSVVHMFNEIPLSNKKEWIDTCNDIRTFQKHYAQWKKPDSNDHIFYDLI